MTQNRTERWPRLMKLSTAAMYCDMSEPYFKGLVENGTMPKPLIEDGRTKRFDRQAIDRVLDSMTAPQQPAPMGGQRI